jgi:hypothetical protein
MTSIVRKLGVRRTMTPNQIVAYNVARARALRGWTQAEAGERLAPFLGSKLSEASFSALERSAWSVNRIKVFSADELLALSRGFDLPIGYFFTPLPPEHDAALHAPDAPTLGLDPIVLLDAVLGRPDNLEPWKRDLLAYAASSAPEPVSKREKPHVRPADLAERVEPLADVRATALLRRRLGDTASAADVLERLIDALRSLDDIEAAEADETASGGTTRGRRADAAARPGTTRSGRTDGTARAGTPRKTPAAKKPAAGDQGRKGRS